MKYLSINNNEVRDLTLSLGMDSPKDTVSYIYAEKFAEEVSNLSDGKMKINIYTDAKLGTDRQMVRQIVNPNSTINFIVQNTSPQVDFIPKLSLFDMPLVYFNIESLRKVLDNELFYEQISNIYTDKGYKLLGLADQLFRQMTSNIKINDIDDFKEVKIRTIQNHNHEAFWKALGATTIALPVSEIYVSLLDGYINSQENPYENIAAFKFYEVQDYVINTYHLPHLVTLITSEHFYNSLTADEQLILEEAAKTATAYAREQADARFQDRRQILIDNGMTIIDLPYETYQEIRYTATPVYERIRNIVNDDKLINSYFGNL